MTKIYKPSAKALIVLLQKERYNITEKVYIARKQDEKASAKLKARLRAEMKKHGLDKLENQITKLDAAYRVRETKRRNDISNLILALRIDGNTDSNVKLAGKFLKGEL